tara:strand:+ start:691 stop:846 length:156 start_codon:yes stop_codon:yes gene_type:complete
MISLPHHLAQPAIYVLPYDTLSSHPYKGSDTLDFGSSSFSPAVFGLLVLGI